MKFFIPLAQDKAQQNKVYTGIKKFIATQFETIPSNRRIYKLTYMHEGKEYLAEVGKIHPLFGETVFAIFYEENRKLYYISTSNRGVLGGMPILCRADQVISFEDFEP